MSETGHARNVEHFTTLISYVTGYGVDYDPSNAALNLTNLNLALIAGNSKMDMVVSALAPSKIAINDRQDAYSGLRKLVTRVVNSFEASGATANAVDDAKGLKRRIDGARAKTLPVDDPNTPEDESQGNSVSQQSFTQLIEHLDNLIALLDADGNYAPNEAELTIDALSTLSGDLKTANVNVLSTQVPLSNARLARNEALYADSTGIFDLAALVKKYVKSLYGADSPQFKQISGLEFTKPRNV